MKITMLIPVVLMLVVAVFCFSGTAPTVAGLLAIVAAATAVAFSFRGRR